MNIAKIRRGECGDPGPYATHCTLDPGHQWSCYDGSKDVSFNHRQDFEHNCTDPDCSRQSFVNEGD